MTNLRPSLGSCTPNWGTHDDRDLRDDPLRLDLAVSLRQLSDPATLGLAPRPVTEELNIEPEGVRPRLRNIDCATKKRLSRPDDRVQTN
jgi:hypothetical protein